MGSAESSPQRMDLRRGYFNIDEIGQSASSPHLSRINQEAQCAVCCYNFCANCRMVFTWKLLLVLAIMAAMAIIMWLNKDTLDEYFYRKEHRGVPV